METLKKTNLSEAVSQWLLTFISTDELKPGDKLPSEPQLCRMLGVSRTAVREGIKALAGINVLSVLPGKGTFINKNPDIMVKKDALEMALEKETVNSIYEVRRVLDAGIAEYAALKATEDDIKALRRALEKTKRSIQSNPIDAPSAIESDEEFHLALCEAAHNKILASIAWPVINHIQLRGYKVVKTSHEIVTLALEGHEKILDAIVKRDVTKATREMGKHLKMAFERIFQNE